MVSLIVYKLNRDSQNGKKQRPSFRDKYRETKKQKRICPNHKNRNTAKIKLDL